MKKSRETEARFGPGWCRKGKCSPKWGSCFSRWLISGDEPLPSLPARPGEGLEYPPSSCAALESLQVLAGTGTGGFGTGVGAPGQQLPSPGCFHLPSHTLNPMAHKGAILAPLWCWISPGSVHWEKPGCFQSEGASPNPLGKEGEPGMSHLQLFPGEQRG